MDLTRMRLHAMSRFGRRDDQDDSVYEAYENDDSLRTDLALEAQQIALDNGRISSLPGVETVEETLPYGTLTRLTIQNDLGAQLMGKAVGTYTTIQVPSLHEQRREISRDVSEDLAAEVRRFLKDLNVASDATVLVVGLGNWNATPDNVGPLTTSKLLVTRHLHEYNVLDEEALGQLRPLAALSPGVLGLTGVETAEIVKGVVDRIQPACVICIDALAARNMDRLGTTFQLADVGINPGAGVGNKRMGLSRETLGVPVLAIGCPTVIYATTIVSEAVDALVSKMEIPDAPTPDSRTPSKPEQQDSGTQTLLDPSRIVVQAREEIGTLRSEVILDPAMRSQLIQEVLGPSMGRLVVTPKEVDLLVETLSDIIADGLNEALHPGVSAEEAARLR